MVTSPKIHGGELGNLETCRFATQMILNLLKNIFANLETNFVPTTMFPGLDKRGKIDEKHNTSDNSVYCLLVRPCRLNSLLYFSMLLYFCYLICCLLEAIC